MRGQFFVEPLRLNVGHLSSHYVSYSAGRFLDGKTSDVVPEIHFLEVEDFPQFDGIRVVEPRPGRVS